MVEKEKFSHFLKFMRWGIIKHGAILKLKNNVAVIAGYKAFPRGKPLREKLNAHVVDQR
jgi:hypothetical protein